MCNLIVLLILIFLYPLLVFPQSKSANVEDSSSMSVFTNDSGATGCYRAASIAARIHYTSTKELENCNIALKQSALSFRDRAATLTNRGIIHMALMNYEMAIKDFSSALDIKPDFGEIHVNIGNVYFMDGVYDKAIEQYTSAIVKQTTKVHVAYINRGMAYEKQGDYENAELDYREAMTLLPDAALPQVRLEQLLNKK
ncbi:MAG: tetratricopeptide (TPR) repeat protein [Gammaproteobacteria bacterium]|jgi:tetratricopeptide (TPR) repeat protein